MVRVGAAELRTIPTMKEEWLTILPSEGNLDLCVLRSPPYGEALLSDSLAHRALLMAARELRIAVLWNYEESCSGRRYAALMLIDEEGNATTNYRCTHLDRSDAAEGLTAGGWMSIAAWRKRRLGLLLGADLDHPEVARSLALMGVDLLLWIDRGIGRADRWHPLARARAIENSVPFIAYDEGLHLLMPDQSEQVAGPSGLKIDLPTPETRPLSLRRPLLYRGLSTEEPPRLT
jgi:predicted amidohydrolase